MSEESFIQSVSFALERALKEAVPVDTSELIQSISARVEDDKIVFNMAEHGIYVEFGTAPHIIRPKNAKALAWGKTIGKTKDGKDMKEHVAKQVYHPGTQPQPFIRNTFYHKAPRIIEQAAMLHLEPGTEVTIEYNDFDFEL